MEEQVIL